MSYRRLVAATSGAGALAVVAIFALSSVASAGVTSPATGFPGAYWSPSTYRDNSGCAQAHAYPAHWTAKTGVGGFKGSTSAKTCPAYRGGLAVSSFGYVDQELFVVAPAAMVSGTGGINVSWDLKVAGSQNAAITTAGPCANTHTYHYGYNYGYTWVNYTDVYTYCSIYASIDLYGYAYLYDMTTSTYFYSSNYWTGVSNYTDMYNDTYHYTTNYSNSSYWGYNSSTFYNYSGSYGGPGSITGVYTPQWFINGTFTSTDSYVVNTYVYDFMESSIDGWTGSASTNLLASGTSHHADLLPFSIW